MAIRAGAPTFQVTSFTDPLITYTVTKDASPGRPWMCDCKAWIFARYDASVGRKKDCKHIRSVQRANAKPMTTTALEHPTGAKVTVDGEQFRVRRPAAKLV